MRYNRYLLAGMILLMIGLIIVFAEFVAGPVTGHIHATDNTYLQTDTITTAILIAIPPLAAGLYIITRHRLKRTEK